MRVLRLLTFDDWDPETNETTIRIAGLIENKSVKDGERIPVALAYQCPECSLTLWESNSSLPDWVRMELDELLLVMRVGAYTSLAVMSRRLVERIAADLGGTGRTLSARLAQLSRADALSRAALLWMNRARQLGNAAAHGVSTNMQDDQGQPIILLPLALVQALFLEAPMETEDEHGIWTTSWETTIKRQSEY